MSKYFGKNIRTTVVRTILVRLTRIQTDHLMKSEVGNELTFLFRETILYLRYSAVLFACVYVLFVLPEWKKSSRLGLKILSAQNLISNDLKKGCLLFKTFVLDSRPLMNIKKSWETSSVFSFWKQVNPSLRKTGFFRCGDAADRNMLVFCFDCRLRIISKDRNG